MIGKICPFCGSDEVVMKSDEFWQIAQVRCSACGAAGPLVIAGLTAGPIDDIESVKALAANRWNSRPPFPTDNIVDLNRLSEEVSNGML